MANYFLTNKAVDDLSQIWNYTYDEWSESQADKYYLLLIDTCNQLSKSPQSGKKYDEITAGIFGFRIEKHIIFYREINSTQIEIIRILHAQMDLKNRIGE